MMAGEVPCSSYMALYIISMHLVTSSSRSSNHWKLNLSSGKVEQASADQDSSKTNTSGNKTAVTHPHHQIDPTTNAKLTNGGDVLFDEVSSQERMMGILSNRVISHDGAWIVTGVLDDEMERTDLDTNSDSCVNCELNNNNNKVRSKKTSDSSPVSSPSEDVKHSRIKSSKSSTKALKKNVSLNCGRSVNTSHYDHLRGVSERHQHVHVPEPDVAIVFKGSDGKSADVDMAQLEQKLHKARRDVLEKGNPLCEKCAQVYNLIGNFWRIKGDTQRSIECFRKALYILPEDPDILLNLARVLYNLQYLDDAIFLARKSLAHQPEGLNAWLHHFTLGQILKAHGHTQEAALHLATAVELNPTFGPAHAHLADLGVDPSRSSGVTHLTLFVAASLVVGVLLGLFVGAEAPKSQRHFNRAMAMRSIKLGINPRRKAQAGHA